MKFTMKSTMTKVAAVAVLSASATAAQAATLNVGDVLSITTGGVTSSGAWDGNGGSFYGIDGNANGKISSIEASGITSLGDITIGSTTVAGDITTWQLYSATGMDFLAIAMSGGTGGVDMSGWTVNWNGGDLDMSSGAWQSAGATNNVMQNVGGFTNGAAKFVWDGVSGHAYTLDYTATFQGGGLTGLQYYLHLEGAVTAVPEASTYGMMLAGLGLVGFAVRRRKLAA
jgi:hypothetical protein